jgi:hypothetical protein
MIYLSITALHKSPYMTSASFKLQILAIVLSSGKNYKCTSTPETPSTLGVKHLNTLIMKGPTYGSFYGIVMV